jgi:hypothetical protein
MLTRCPVLCCLLCVPAAVQTRGCHLHRPVHLCLPDLRSTLQLNPTGLNQQGMHVCALVQAPGLLVTSLNKCVEPATADR